MKARARQEDTQYIERIIASDMFGQASVIDRMRLVIFTSQLIDSSLLDMGTVRIPLMSTLTVWIRNLTRKGKLRVIEKMANHSTDILSEDNEAIGLVVSCRAFLQSSFEVRIALMAAIAQFCIKELGGTPPQIKFHSSIKPSEQVTIGTLSGLAARLSFPEKIGLLAEIAATAMLKIPSEADSKNAAEEPVAVH
jgi:hypothetical protein